MASLDPRKAESITNQANYLLTVVTTLLINALYSSIQTGDWNVTGYTILLVFWITPQAYKEIKKIVDRFTNGDSNKDHHTVE